MKDRQFRPSVEVLDQRTLLAGDIYSWTPGPPPPDGKHLWSNVNNWRVGEAVPASQPDEDDIVKLSGGGATCWLDGNKTVKGFEVTGMNSVNINGKVLTVKDGKANGGTDVFKHTKGVISLDGGDIILDNTDGIVDRQDNGFGYLSGSGPGANGTFKVKNNSVLTMRGNADYQYDARFIVESKLQLEMLPTNQGFAQVNLSEKGDLDISAGGELILNLNKLGEQGSLYVGGFKVAPANPNTLTNAGTIKKTGNAKAELTLPLVQSAADAKVLLEGGRLGFYNLTQEDHPGLDISGGLVRVRPGTVLIGDGTNNLDYKQTGGTFMVGHNAAMEGGTATFWGSMVLTEGDLYIGDPAEGSEQEPTLPPLVFDVTETLDISCITVYMSTHMTGTEGSVDLIGAETVIIGDGTALRIRDENDPLNASAGWFDLISARSGGIAGYFDNLYTGWSGATTKNYGDRKVLINGTGEVIIQIVGLV